jgi:hypothetical protein
VGVNKLSKVHFLFTFLPPKVGENMQKMPFLMPEWGARMFV